MKYFPRVAASEDEAKELRDMVVEQRVHLRNMEAEVQEQRSLVRGKAGLHGAYLCSDVLTVLQTSV